MARDTWLGVGVVVGVMSAPLWADLPWLWATLLVACLPALLVLRDGITPTVVGLCVGVLAVQLPPAGPVLRGPVALHGRVASPPVGRTADVALWRAGAPGRGLEPAGRRVRVRFPSRAPRLGSEVIAWGEADALHGSLLPGGPSVALGVPSAGLRTEVLARAAQVVDRTPDPPLPEGARHAGVLRALAVGDRTHLDPAVVRRLRRTGTAHLLAISGFHVGVVAGTVGLCLAGLVRLAALRRPCGLPVGWVWPVAATAGVAYAWVAGAPVSAQRAALLLILGAVVRALGGRLRVLAALALIAAVLVVADPAVAWSPSFQLSFGAVVGLSRLVPAIEASRPTWCRGPLAWVWRSVGVSAAATVGTLPAAGWWFQAVAPLGPIANLVAIPITTFLLAPLAALSTVGPGPLATWSGWTADLAVDALLLGLAPFDVTPLPVALGPLSAIALAAALLLHRRWAWLLAGLITLHPGVPPPNRGLRVTFPDVGQGSAALVEWADGRRWLVDGGPGSDRVLHWLRRRGVHHLDVVVASHGQTDHVGGLEAVVRELQVGALWLPAGARDDPQLRPVVSAALERQVPVLPGPPANLAGDERAWLRSENDRSVVLAPSTEGWAVLLPGDLERLGERAVLDVLPERVAVVAIPHHGSRSSSTPAFVDATRPAVAVAQVGHRNRYGHPTDMVMRRWAEAGARTWRTDRDGTVEITVGGGHVRVRTWSWDAGWRTDARWPLRRDPWTAAGLAVAPDTGEATLVRTP